jgi:hypothetical protein
LLKGKFDREVNASLPTCLREKSGVFEESLIKA